MSTVIEEFVATLGWEVDPKVIDEFNRKIGQAEQGFEKAAGSANKASRAVGKTSNALRGSTAATVRQSASFDKAKIAVAEMSGSLGGFVKRAEQSAKKIVGIASIIAGAFSVVTVAINRQTAEHANLAASVGLSAEALDVWAGLAKEIGFEADNVVDLVEEMNNKLGEKAGLGEMKAVEETMKILKLDFEDIRKLKPEDQFLKILEAAKGLEDAQQAVSAVDMLLGGEANKFLGFLRTQEESLEVIIERRKALILLDEEGRKGAQQFTKVWGLFAGLIGSLVSQFSGLLGEALVPILNQTIDWVTENKKLIKTKLKQWVEQALKVIKFLISGIKFIVSEINKWTDAVGGLTKAFKILAAILIAIKLRAFVSSMAQLIVLLKGATAAQTALNVATAAFAAIKAIGIIGLLALIILIIEDLYQAFTGGESLLKNIFLEAVKVVEEYIDMAAQFWANLFGLSKEEFDAFLVKAFGDWESFKKFIADMLFEIGQLFVTAWTGIAKWVSKTAGKIKDSIVSAFSTAIKVVIASLKKLGRFAFNTLKDLPIVGGILKSETVQNIAENFLGSPAVTAPATGAVTGGSVANNNQQSIQNTEVQATMNITQSPGESGTDFANRVVNVLEEQAAVAVKNNNTGLVF
jgi:hypothetical protein